MRFGEANLEGASSAVLAGGSQLNFLEIAGEKPGKTENKAAKTSPESTAAKAPSEITKPQHPQPEFYCSTRPVKPTDTLDSLAKEVAGANASKESIETCTKIIRKVNEMKTDRPQELSSIILPVKNPDGSFSYSYKENCAEKYTTWPDGKTRVENSLTGQGQFFYREADKTLVLKSWGPEEKDNYVCTKYPDKTIKSQFSSGFGSLQKPDGTIKLWGPERYQNATTTYTIDKDGHMVLGPISAPEKAYEAVKSAIGKLF